MKLETVPRRWHDPGHLCIVAAPGPSLTPEVAEMCRGHDVIAVQDAYRRVPWAPILYGCDTRWWKWHCGAPDFAGEKWTTHSDHHHSSDKREFADQYGLRCVEGAQEQTFSTDPTRIYYGFNSGFQAVGLAILFGAQRVVLVGFDMRHHKGCHHFFGNHPAPLHNPTNYSRFIKAFETAAKKPPEGVTIINATPDSALTCFPRQALSEALAG